MVKKHYYQLSSEYKLKIILLSDIHYSRIFKLKNFDILTEEIKLEKPDYICITGDLLDTAKSEDEIVYNWLLQLTSIAPVIFTMGNHDIIKSKKYYLNINWILKLKKIPNFYLLDNNSIEFEKIIFHSYNEVFNKELKRVDYSIDNFCNNFKSKNYIYNVKKYNVLLSHSPQSFLEKSEILLHPFITRMDLILCGHMHNGMIPPILDNIVKHYGIIGPSKRFFPPDAKGFYDFLKTKLIISGGITKLSNSSSKVLHKFDNLYNRDIDIIAI